MLFGKDVKDVDVDMVVKKRNELISDRGKKVSWRDSCALFYLKCKDSLLILCPCTDCGNIGSSGEATMADGNCY